MQEERYKMREFLGKLWMNPALQKTTIDKKENQVLSFLRENQSQLQKIFAQHDYFPNLSWNDAVKLLLTELVDKLLESISPKIDFIYQNILTSSTLKAFGDEAAIDGEKFKYFLIDQMKTKSLRDQYLSAIQIVSLNYFQNYIPPALERHKYIYNELMRHDRLKMDAELIPAYLCMATLFRPLFYYTIKLQEDSADGTSLSRYVKDKKTFEIVLQKLRNRINTLLGSAPEILLLPGIQSNLMLSDFPQISGTARLIAIMAARSADYTPLEKRDRGAESPDKSWFHINRRNAKVYGIDGDMVDEFYHIAGDQGW